MNGEAGSPAGSESEQLFPPSRLGTKEYWDDAYKRELQTFQECGDYGEVWFGEESISRLIRWLKKQKIPLDTAILDIGTGNGMFLTELAKSGYINLAGIDYCPAAIELAKRIFEKEGFSQSIRLQVEDFLNLSSDLSEFDIGFDKGTFDAVSLDPENAVEKREQFVMSLKHVLKPEGFFIITSCNWTKEELLHHFREGFEFVEELPSPKFSFGGRTGSSVTVLVFKNNSQMLAKNNKPISKLESPMGKD
ncbi:EEF1A lysine methyltransferase 2 isoform X1 [Microcaecilia unicolor]|uniref:EEF1A lysine methyltransferase 2 n=1 Tax=Microcaecilia unicolor TaxID=1415580 RepID=A0A6P7Y6K2_9AMPH|nr:EEF1A lysine methyltransferase 2 isoform X1 [Microcaecilia unicolor]